MRKPFRMKQILCILLAMIMVCGTPIAVLGEPVEGESVVVDVNETLNEAIESVEAEEVPNEAVESVEAEEVPNEAIEPIEVEEVPSEVVESELVAEEELSLPSEESRLTAYFDQVALTGQKVSANSQVASRNRAYRKRRLSQNSAAVYDTLYTFFDRIASGKEEVAYIEIPVGSFAENRSYTKEELGVTSLMDGDQLSTEAQDALLKLFDVNVSKVVDALLSDVPYELYWFDKTSGYSHGIIVSIASDGNSVLINNDACLIFAFVVSDEYGMYDPSDNMSMFNVNTEKTGSVSVSVNRALTIVSDASSLSDYEKLNSYRATICDDVSYANGTSGSPYGNPWQIIYVFDEDPDTNVVCEGYSKAFKFLCDLTDFDSDQIESGIVTGIMNGGTGEGNHMWNVMKMDDGKNYLVDVTNCDQGTVGYPDKLFLKGTSEATVNPNCAKRDSEGQIEYYYDSFGYVVNNVSYIYDDDTLGVYDTAELTLAADHYSNTPHDTTHTHSYGGWEKVDDRTHQRMCSGCSDVESEAHMFSEESSMPATCTSEGEINYICSGCGATKTEKTPVIQHTLEHIEGTPATCEADGVREHWRCSDCGQDFSDAQGKTIIQNVVDPKTGHSWDAGVVTTKPTPSKTGQRTYTCTRCGETKTETIPATGRISISKATISAIPAKAYTGSAQKPGVTVKYGSTTLKLNTDYTVAYKNNTNVGTATVTITGKGDYKDTKSVTFKINRIKLASAALKKTSLVYNGKNQTTAVTVTAKPAGKARTLKAGTDYTLKWKNNKYVGTATVTITGKGNYTGTISKTFNIIPKGTSISKVSAGKKEFTVNWKKQATQTTGYQIQYSTNKSFKKGNKTVTISKNKTTSRKIKKLAAKKTYYVRVRTYRKVGKRYYYSAWSGAKKVKTKK